MRRLYSALSRWLHQQAMRRHARKRLAFLQRQLAQHDEDMLTMARFPKRVQDRMVAYRLHLLTQIEVVQEHV